MRTWLRSGRRRWRAALLHDFAIGRIGFSHLVAEVARVFGVFDRAVCLEQAEIGVACLLRVRMQTNHILEVNDRRIESFSL